MVAQEKPEVPCWQLHLAGLTGFLGFVAVHGWLGSARGLRLHLPPHEPSPYGTDMLDAALALLGAAAGLGLAWLMIKDLGRPGRPGQILKSSEKLEGSNSKVVDGGG